MIANDIQLTLSSEYSYRREWFGGILFSHRSKQARFYNHAAALSIEALVSPGGQPSPIFRPDPRFIERLHDQQIAVPRSVGANPGRAFFRDIHDFEPDRLHTPLGVELELTLKCMRRCSYCAYDARPDVAVHGELSQRSYQSVFAKLADAGVCQLRVTGGDPLTRADCLDILRDADAYPFGLAIASDLTTFSSEIARGLSELHNLTALHTTLDGPNPAIADQLRGKGNFRQVTAALEALTAYGIPVTVGTIVGKHNVAHIYDTAKLLSRWPVSWCISPLYAAGRARSATSLVPDDDDMARAYEQFAQAIADGLVRPADPAWRPIVGPRSVVARARLWESLPWLVRSPDRTLRIDPTGRCYTSIHLKEVLSDDVYVGNIVKDDLTQLWNGAPLLEALRQRRHRSAYFGDVFDIRRIGKTETNVERRLERTLERTGRNWALIRDSARLDQPAVSLDPPTEISLAMLRGLRTDDETVVHAEHDVQAVTPGVRAHQHPAPWLTGDVPFSGAELTSRQDPPLASRSHTHAEPQRTP
ncbi:radical SAM protein [Enhygromyxa salina]|uniref:Antilisterial bacteriocin subtilosin biosynthesis protein AlbA n=1 Tax=Enhygromyxa salina TaxID=215803 RepID=A0A2S9XKY2_9BACT|nr:radical SAM protein [Enhygromyxa salina]PRP93513.1 Antilisterial bacteriocin subtilosin biosynthesis protein AlbA [Enhygromyxa salina]